MAGAVGIAGGGEAEKCPALRLAAVTPFSSRLVPSEKVTSVSTPTWTLLVKPPSPPVSILSSATLKSVIVSWPPPAETEKMSAPAPPVS